MEKKKLSYPRTRPGHDIFCPPEEFPFATFVTLSYHKSLIALHRPALTSHTTWLRSRVSYLCAGTPWRSRLRYSLCIGAASARAILKTYNDMILYSNGSRLTTLSQLMLATMTLSIYVTKIPSSLMNSSDLAMVLAFAESIEQKYLNLGQDAEFDSHC
ncbi:hypothetical protein BJY00DRAFT_320128 [Aspergillus carlsbadensis]|nr:hypothetical protein BJY00DRAFT_320128 [Aspergillus carlsbadensis]